MIGEFKEDGMTKTSIKRRLLDRMNGVVGHDEPMSAEDRLITGMIDWMGSGNLGEAVSLCDELVGRYGSAEEAVSALDAGRVKLERADGKFRLEVEPPQ
jgi:hypothetical protein